MAHILLPHTNIKADGPSVDMQVTQMLMETVVKKMDAVEKAIKQIPTLHVSTNKDGDVVSEITENGMTKTIIDKQYPIIKRLETPINRYKKD